MRNVFRNMDQVKLRYLGIGLIVLGVMAALNLWGLIPALVLAGIGGYLYVERRKEGRVAAAVQSGLWLVGMAALLLIHFVFPGVLLLAGASLLMRGHEPEVDRRVNRFLAGFGVNLPPMGQAPAQAAPMQTAQNVPYEEEERATTGETTRL